MKRFSSLLFFLLPFLLLSAQETPKREFRGAWIHTVKQPQYADMEPAAMRCYFDSLVGGLQQAGINALIFQVRPEADAFYPSEIEPWSRYLTGEQGRAPEPLWDPLAYLIDRCHERNIEFHAWVNPYRVKMDIKDELAPSHIYNRHPEWFIAYGGQLFFDPALPESREFIARVIDDLVTRYDLDAIHMDDYFYPYPIASKPFPDDASYERYGNGMPRGDWRRHNVDILIEEVSALIKKRKPWVRFGISPFGIYRNKSSWVGGSDTRGLQNYDDLYADVLLWARNGWIDYLVPQLYWEVGHRAACYEKLIYWWNDALAGSPCHLYIGQDVVRSVDCTIGGVSSPQINYKLLLARHLDSVSGNCFWSGYKFLEYYDRMQSLIREDFFSTPVLIPAYTAIDDAAPEKVSKLHTRWTPDGFYLEWKADDTRDAMQKAAYYCVYRFGEKEPVDIENPAALVGIVREPHYRLDYKKGTERCVYVVTAVDRMHNESEPRSLKVRL